MFAGPGRIGEFDSRDRLAEVLPDRLGQPARCAIAADLDAVGVAPLGELRAVEKNEPVGARDLMEVTEPRQVIRLMDGDDQSVRPKITYSP